MVNFGAEVVAVDALRGRTGGRRCAPLAAGRGRSRPDRVAHALSPAADVANNPLVGKRLRQLRSDRPDQFNTGPLQRGRLLSARAAAACASIRSPASRSGNAGKFPPQAEIFGDGELIFVADPRGDEVLVLAPSTARSRQPQGRAGRAPLDDPRPQRAGLGPGRHDVKVRLYDAWQQDAKERRPRPLVAAGPARHRGCSSTATSWPCWSRAGNSRSFRWPPARSFAVPLEPEPALTTSRCIARATVRADHQPEQPDAAAGPARQSADDGQSAAGPHARPRVCLRADTGKLQWQVPAFVAIHALPTDSRPSRRCLFFVRNRTDVTERRQQRQTDVGAVSSIAATAGSSSTTAVGPQANHGEIIADPVKRTVTLLAPNGRPRRSSSR